jgi:hypothetical protein
VKVHRFAALSTVTLIHNLLPGFVDKSNERTRGAAPPQAGFGHVTIRAHIQAVTGD